jgi:integrase
MQALRWGLVARNVSKVADPPKAQRKEIRPLTPEQVGTPLNRHNFFRRCFKPILEKAGLPHTVGFHDLRHTCATLLLSKNVNPKIVQELLGHANISQTMDTYSHVLPDMQERAASAMDDIFP